MDGYCTVYAYFAPLGIAAAAYVILKILHAVFSDMRMYLWSRVGPQIDLTSAYGKWAIVTGGSDGIGKGYAMELAKRGVNICVISNFENGIVSEIRKNSQVDCMWIDADFSSLDVYPKIENELKSIIDDVGILVNNVGIVQPKPELVSAQTGEFNKKIVNVNVMTAVMMTPMVLNRMIKKNRGLIVNMGSISSCILFPYATLYSSSKSFLETYSCCLAAELNHTNVQVKCIQPSFIRTQLVQGFDKVIGFLDKFVWWSLPDAPTFAASATATFGHSTPVLYSGCWSHSIIQFVTPYSLLGKEKIAKLSVWFHEKLIGDFM